MSKSTTLQVSDEEDSFKLLLRVQHCTTVGPGQRLLEKKSQKIRFFFFFQEISGRWFRGIEKYTHGVKVPWTAVQAAPLYLLMHPRAT